MELLVLPIAMVFSVIIILGANIRIIAQRKPKSANYQNREYAEKLSREKQPSLPLTDAEYKQIKKCYSSTEGAAIAVPLLALITAAASGVALAKSVMPFFMIVYAALIILSCVLAVISFRKNKNALLTDRDSFTKKRAYLIDSDSRQLYTINRHGHLRESGTAYYIAAAFSDEDGRQLTYKLQVPYQKYMEIHGNKTCYAVLYKGVFSTFIRAENDTRE